MEEDLNNLVAYVLLSLVLLDAKSFVDAVTLFHLGYCHRCLLRLPQHYPALVGSPRLFHQLLLFQQSVKPSDFRSASGAVPLRTLHWIWRLSTILAFHAVNAKSHPGRLAYVPWPLSQPRP